LPEHSLTLIIPVFNESENLEKLNSELLSFLDQFPLPTTVLFVNDGSKDDSLDKIKAMVNKEDRFDFISLRKNSGLSTAIKAGIDYAKTDLIAYMDSDMQTSPMDLISFLPFIDEYEMINGIRTGRKDSVIKKMSSIIANQFRRIVIKDGIEDTCCPLKIMHADVAKKMPFFKGMHRFMPALCQLQGGKVKQLPVKHFPRYAGSAKYHLFNRLTGPFFDTMAFAWMRKRNIRYEISESKSKVKEHLKIN